jgi:hypothetical protein
MRIRPWLLLVFLSVMMPWFLMAEEPFRYDGGGLRDPFLPLVTEGGALVNYDRDPAVSELVLEGIVFDGSRSLAVINGDIFQEGQKVGLYLLDRIASDRVLLSRDGETFMLQLNKED